MILQIYSITNPGESLVSLQKLLFSVGFWSTTICDAISLLPGSKLFVKSELDSKKTSGLRRIGHERKIIKIVVPNCYDQ
jgi:hypothetical protein